jgi:hypothetical protein
MKPESSSAKITPFVQLLHQPPLEALSAVLPNAAVIPLVADTAHDQQYRLFVIPCELVQKPSVRQSKDSCAGKQTETSLC